MIYDFPDLHAPIRQGDIFIGLPKIDISLQEMPVLTGQGASVTVERVNWKDLAYEQKRIRAVVGIEPVKAIVATQNCDALRARDITLCEIREFRDVERKSKQTTSPTSWKDIITQQARINLKWFYLPPDEALGFTEKMGVDFLVTLRLPREDLEQFRFLRKGRLIQIAEEHFRERISEFFRRYPYDEWYPLSLQEFETYKKDHADASPFPWQKPGDL